MYVTLETKSIFTGCISVGCHYTRQDMYALRKTLGPIQPARYIREDTVHVVIFRETGSINYWNLIKIVTPFFEKELPLFILMPI